MSEVLIRRRFWRTKELEPTQERAKYLGPSFVHHGHWVEREDGEPSFDQDGNGRFGGPPFFGQLDCIGGRAEETAVQAFMVEGEFTQEERQVIPPELYEGDKDEEERMERDVKLRKVIEEEMSHAVHDHPTMAGIVVDAMASLKEATVPHQQNEALQTRVVSPAEVRRNLTSWIPAITAELTSLLSDKEALATITEKEVKVLMEKELADYPLKAGIHVKA